MFIKRPIVESSGLSSTFAKNCDFDCAAVCEFTTLFEFPKQCSVVNITKIACFSNLYTLGGGGGGLGATP